MMVWKTNLALLTTLAVLVVFASQPLFVSAASAMQLCNGNVTFRASIEVTQIDYNATSGAIVFYQTDSFVAHVNKTATGMRVDYRTTSGGQVSVYGLLSGSGTARLDATSGACNTITTDSVFIKARDVYATLKSLIKKNVTQGLTSVTYHGMTMLHTDNPSISTTEPTAQYDGYTAKGYFTQPDGDQLDFVVPSSCGIVKFVNLNKTSANGLTSLVNITFGAVGLSVEGTDSTTPCMASNAATASPANVTPSAANPMPTLPTAYSATILTTEVESGDSFTMMTSFDSAARRARVVVLEPVVDFVGRATRYIWDVIGTDQTAYYYVERALPVGGTSTVSDAVRDYFWPTTEECHRAIFTTDILSGSLSGLFAMTGKQIVYVGEELVRGIPSRRWQTSNGTLVMDWYWANTSWNIARRGSDGTDTLVRVAVRGTGQSPMFTYHPFFQQGEAVPKDIADDACNRLFPQSSSFCAGDNTPNYVFYHVHDILEFSPYTDSSSGVLPSACSNPTSVEVYGSVGCTTTNGLSAGIVVVFIFLLFAVFFCGMCCQWCRMTPRMREIEEELHDAVKAMHEHQEQLDRAQSDLSPRDSGNGDEVNEQSSPRPPPALVATAPPVAAKSS
jgi:hypothetical protein